MERLGGNLFGGISLLCGSVLFAVNAIGCVLEYFCVPWIVISLVGVLSGLIGMRYDKDGLFGKVGCILGVVESVIYFVGVLIQVIVYYA